MAPTNTHTLYAVCLCALSTIFNSDLQKEQEAPRGCDGYARHRDCVCVWVRVNTHLHAYLTILHPVAELWYLFSLVYFTTLCKSSSVYWENNTCTQMHTTADTLVAGNSQADVLSPRFLSHPSRDLSLQLCESGWEGPERDRSIRLLWQGWGWHLNPQRQGREEDDEQEEEEY